jgi:hypothetical protein
MQQGAWIDSGSGQRSSSSSSSSNGGLLRNGILGSPAKKAWNADGTRGDVRTVYLTINPDASGCSALLLLIGMFLRE